MTAEDKRAQIDRRFDETFAVFDERMRTEQETISQERASRAGSAGGSGTEGTEGQEGQEGREGREGAEGIGRTFRPQNRVGLRLGVR